MKSLRYQNPYFFGMSGLRTETDEVPRASKAGGSVRGQFCCLPDHSSQHELPHPDPHDKQQEPEPPLENGHDDAPDDARDSARHDAGPGDRCIAREEAAEGSFSARQAVENRGVLKMPDADRS